jgi:hypothetical protein
MRYITVLQGQDGRCVRAYIHGDFVGFWVGKYPNCDGSGCSKRYGYVNPKTTGRWWWEKTQPSVQEALERTVADMHRQEFLTREAASQIDAARATMRALAEIEKELSA